MKVFEKYNTTGYRDALIKEAKGLSLLKASCDEHGVDICVPDVFSVDEQKLEITEIETRSPTPEQMKSLGMGLAKIHQTQASLFGLQYDNYIGLNPQKNHQDASWGDFFISQRLLPQISWIKDEHLQSDLTIWLDNLRASLKFFLDEYNDGPSLLHGDLWSGNAVFDQQHAWLIDPAVYFGDREVDIAMTEMFSGFTTDFYQGYNQIWPLGNEYSLKKSIYNLYHFLNHYNLFGDGYLQSVRDLMRNIKA